MGMPNIGLAWIEKVEPSLEHPFGEIITPLRSANDAQLKRKSIMKFWLLTRTVGSITDLDVMNSVLVRAGTRTQARKIAASVAGDEGSDTWNNAEKSTCKLVPDEGSAGVICRDFNAG